MRRDIPDEDLKDIVEDYAKKGIVVTHEQVREKVLQLVEILKLAHEEGLLQSLDCAEEGGTICAMTKYILHGGYTSPDMN